MFKLAITKRLALATKTPCISCDLKANQKKWMGLRMNSGIAIPLFLFLFGEVEYAMIVYLYRMDQACSGV